MSECRTNPRGASGLDPEAVHDDNDDNEFRVVAEDSAGNVQERTFRVDYDPTPRVSVTENATNATAETVRVARDVSEARIDRVTLESIDTRSGERLDIARVYEAGAPTTTTVEFDRTLTAVPDKTVVNLIVAYDHGQYSRSITPAVSTSVESDEEGGTDAPAVTGTEGGGSTGDESASDGESSGVVGAATGGGDAPTDGDEESTEQGGPALVPIRTREALGGVVVVGATYLLGHRI